MINIFLNFTIENAAPTGLSPLLFYSYQSFGPQGLSALYLFEVPEYSISIFVKNRCGT